MQLQGVHWAKLRPPVLAIVFKSDSEFYIDVAVSAGWITAQEAVANLWRLRIVESEGGGEAHSGAKC